MTIRTRPATAGALLVLSLLLAAGCRMPFGARPTPTPSPVTLNLVTFGGAWNRAEETVLEQYQERHPQVEFDRREAFQLIDQVLAASPPPDLVATIAGYALGRAAQEQRLLDMTDVWERAGLQTALPEALRALSTYEGEQVLIPISYPWNAIYYNRALFEELNLAPPETWDEFLMVCETLVLEGITPLSLSGEGPLLTMLWFDCLNLRINGPEFHRRLLEGEVAFDDPRVIAVLEAWSLLFRRSYVAERQVRLTTNEFESVVALVRGDGGQLGGQKAAMTLANSVVLADLPPNLQDELGFFRFPVVDPSIALAEALVLYGYTVPAQAEDPEAALDFLAYAVGPEAQELMAQQMNAGPAVHAPANPAVDRDLLDEELRAGMDLIGGADELTPFLMASVPDPMVQAIGRALRTFLQEPDDVYGLASALEEARRQMVAQGLWGAPQ